MAILNDGSGGGDLTPEEEMAAKPDRRPTEVAKRRRMTASAEIVEEEMPELSINTRTPVKIKNMRPGFRYRLTNAENVDDYCTNRGWKVCDHAEVLANLTRDIDAAQPGTAIQRRRQVLLCQPQAVYDRVRALKAAKVDATERDVTAQYNADAKRARQEMGLREDQASIRRPDFTGLTRSEK